MPEVLISDLRENHLQHFFCHTEELPRMFIWSCKLHNIKTQSLKCIVIGLLNMPWCDDALHLNKVKSSEPCLATRWNKYDNWFCRWMGAYCSIGRFIHAIHPWAVILSRISLSIKSNYLSNAKSLPYQQKDLHKVEQ